MEKTTHSRIPALDAIRGLAILLVTLFRFRPEEGPRSYVDHVIFGLPELGFYGVDLFFVLSGFLITGILYDAKGQPNYFRDFYARRTLRIFPLYYGTLFVAIVVIPYFWPQIRTFDLARENQVWLWLYGENILMSWRNEWCFGAFDHFWSLAVEEHFYLLWPLVIYCCSRRGAMKLAASLGIMAFMSRIAWISFGGNRVAAEVCTLFRLDGLLAGAWLALVARGPGGLERWIPAAKTVLWTTGLAMIPVIVTQRIYFTIPSGAMTVFFTALTLLAVTAEPQSWTARFWNSRFLQILGTYSYGMYVFQKPLVPLLAAWINTELFTNYFGSLMLGRLLYLVVMSLATFAMAFASWHLYEKHFLKLKCYFGGKSAPAALPEPDLAASIKVPE